MMTTILLVGGHVPPSPCGGAHAMQEIDQLGVDRYLNFIIRQTNKLTKANASWWSHPQPSAADRHAMGIEHRLSHTQKSILRF